MRTRIKRKKGPVVFHVISDALPPPFPHNRAHRNRQQSAPLPDDCVELDVWIR
uniref:Uncharacterized protein n=1 Tax=Anguilla anguilla TaxID=7936 RepID=A0A0E9S1H4_ANGAN